MKSPGSVNPLEDAYADPIAIASSLWEQGEEAGAGLPTWHKMLRLAGCLLLFSCGIIQISFALQLLLVSELICWLTSLCPSMYSLGLSLASPSLPEMIWSYILLTLF